MPHDYPQKQEKKKQEVNLFFSPGLGSSSVSTEVHIGDGQAETARAGTPLPVTPRQARGFSSRGAGAEPGRTTRGSRFRQTRENKSALFLTDVDDYYSTVLTSLLWYHYPPPTVPWVSHFWDVLSCPFTVIVQSRVYR